MRHPYPYQVMFFMFGIIFIQKSLHFYILLDSRFRGNDIWRLSYSGFLLSRFILV